MKFRLFSAMALTGLLHAAPAMAGGHILVRADELSRGTFDNLVMLPDGCVFHMMRLHLGALFEVYGPGDTLVYGIDDHSLVVRHDIPPSELLLVEPIVGNPIEPVLFPGIDPANEIAILEEGGSFFYSSFPGYPFSQQVLDGRDRLIFVGNITEPYRRYQPPINPFQPDSDIDGVPDAADNCIFQANGPLIPDTGNNIQRDTDGDGFGNACDADLNNDLIINFLDLDMMQEVFFSNPASPNWNPDVDFNGDDFVNFTDLDLMRATFFGPPGPSGLVQ